MTDAVGTLLEVTGDKREVRPMAAIVSIPVQPANTLKATVTCVGSYTSTANGGDADADVDAD